jgi:hypothetical protein
LGTFLESKLHYQIGTTLFAAQYDWRQPQQSGGFHQKFLEKLSHSDVMNVFYENLRLLVESAVNSTQRKAVLLGHSMGNIVINRFLRDKVTPVGPEKNNN